MILPSAFFSCLEASGALSSPGFELRDSLCLFFHWICKVGGSSGRAPRGGGGCCRCPMRKESLSSPALRHLYLRGTLHRSRWGWDRLPHTPNTLPPSDADWSLSSFCPRTCSSSSGTAHMLQLAEFERTVGISCAWVFFPLEFSGSKFKAQGIRLISYSILLSRPIVPRIRVSNTHSYKPQLTVCLVSKSSGFRC